MNMTTIHKIHKIKISSINEKKSVGNGRGGGGVLY